MLKYKNQLNHCLMIVSYDQLKIALFEFFFPSIEVEVKIKSLLSRAESNQWNTTNRQLVGKLENLWVFANICRYVCFFFVLDRPQQLFLAKRRVMNKWLPW